MKFAFSKPTTNPADTEFLFQSFREQGYAGLQMKPGQYGAFVDRPDDFLKTYGHLTGIASALIVAGGIDAKSMHDLDRVMEFGRKVGTELVVYCQWGPDREQVTPQVIEESARVLSAAGLRARDRGLKLSMHHHHGFPVMLRPEFDIFFNMVEQTAPGSVGLTIDTAHLVKSGIHDIASVIRDFAGTIDNFHLKDFADGDWRVLGEGAIDFKPVFAAIKSIGYDGWISTDEESGSTLADAMPKCLKFMRDGLK